MERPFVSENASSRRELAAVAKRLSDSDLNRDAGEGWTVAIAFAHLAFWDSRALVTLRRWKESGIRPAQLDIDLLNEALLPLCRAVAPRAAVDLAIAAARAVDEEIEGLHDHLVSQIEASGETHRLSRFIHRRVHIEQIETLLRPSNRTD